MVSIKKYPKTTQEGVESEKVLGDQERGEITRLWLFTPKILPTWEA
jgi:hypothetical protein